MTKTHVILALSLFMGGHFASGQTPNLNPLPLQKKVLAWGWQDETILTATTDGHCRWWTSDGVCRDSFAFGLGIPENFCAVFTKNSHFLLAQTGDASFGVWDVPARTKIFEKRVEGQGLHAISISPDNRFLAASFQTGIAVYDSTGAEMARFQHEKTPISLAVSDKGLILACYQNPETGEKITKIWGFDAKNWELRDQRELAAREIVSPEKTKVPPLELPEIPGEEKTGPQKVVLKNSAYALSVGSFSKKENARKRLADAQSWGFKNAEIVRNGKNFSVVAEVFETHDEAWRAKRNLEDRYSIHAAVVRQK